DGRRQTVHTHRPAIELLDDREQQLAVHDVKAVPVNIEHVQSLTRDLDGNFAVRAHFGEVANAPEQAIGDARRTARTRGDLAGTFVRDIQPENAGGTLHNTRQIRRVVKLQTLHDAE